MGKLWNALCGIVGGHQYANGECIGCDKKLIPRKDK